VQAVLAARIDRLSAEDKRILQLASVIGRTVPLTLLRTIAEIAEPDLQRSLAHLQTGEFIYEARLFPEPEYAFRHALTLDVAYAGLLQETRRELHVRIVEALERLYPERLSEHAARLAHHAFRGEVWGKALTYLSQQSEMAASRSSLDTVLGTDAGVGSNESAGALWWSGDHRRAIEVSERDLTVAANFRTFGMSIVALCRLGQANHTIGDFGRAAELLRRPLAQLQGDLEREHFGMASLPAVFARAWLAWCLAEVGSFDEGVVHGEDAVAIAEKAEHPYSRAVAAWGLGTLHVVRGDAERAIRILEPGLVVTRVANFPILFPFIAPPLGAAYAQVGRVSEGVALIEPAIRQAISMDLKAHHALRLTWLGETLLRGGHVQRAHEQAVQAVTLAERQGERASHAYAKRLLGESARLREPPDLQAALSELRDALRLANTLGMRPLAARCQLDLAAAHQAVGASDEARAERDRAIETFRELGMLSWLGGVDARGVMSR
jgi:tetratricopeptide (TPR) repeat protein